MSLTVLAACYSVCAATFFSLAFGSIQGLGAKGDMHTRIATLLLRHLHVSTP
jgi:hypothetical protein